MSTDERPGEQPSHEFAVVGSRTIYSGAILSLRVDDVEMPGGRVAAREVVEHYGSVAIVAIDDQQRVAMVRQYRHPIGRRLLELPAGLIDKPDEEPLAAAERELAEEVDLAADRWRVLVDVDLSPGFTDEALRTYLAEGLHRLDAAERADEEADMTVEWVHIDDAVAKVFAGEIVNSSAVSGILAADAALRGSLELRPPDAPWIDRPTALDERKRQA